jgi:hypothetical protein
LTRWLLRDWHWRLKGDVGFDFKGTYTTTPVKEYVGQIAVV